MRLIDADSIPYTMLYKEIWMKGTGEEVKGVWKSDIDNMPTIDAVPVVRCKDCRFHEDEQPGMVYCPATVGGWVENDWFCKGGERKDDE